MAQMPAPATVLLTALGSSEDGGGQQGRVREDVERFLLPE